MISVYNESVISDCNG